MSKDTKQRGSALVRLLRAKGNDPEVELAVGEYLRSWLGRFNGVRHTPPEGLVLLSAQKTLVRGLLLIGKETGTPEAEGMEIAALLKVAIPVANSFRLNERSLERLAGGSGRGKQSSFQDVIARYKKGGGMK